MPHRHGLPRQHAAGLRAEKHKIMLWEVKAPRNFDPTTCDLGYGLGLQPTKAAHLTPSRHEALIKSTLAYMWPAIAVVDGGSDIVPA